MYNGIGLSTPRGSGTNGYIQRNLSALPPKREKINYQTEADMVRMEKAMERKPNKEILEHEWKRKIELKCLELREELESQGHSETEIEQHVESLRSNLLGKGYNSADVDPSANDSHHLAEAAQKKRDQLREAFKISADYVDGSAFDPTQQALRAERRKAEKAKANESRKTWRTAATEQKDAELPAAAQPDSHALAAGGRDTHDDQGDQEPQVEEQSKEFSKEQSFFGGKVVKTKARVGNRKESSAESRSPSPCSVKVRGRDDVWSQQPSHEVPVITYPEHADGSHDRAADRSQQSNVESHSRELSKRSPARQQQRSPARQQQRSPARQQQRSPASEKSGDISPDPKRQRKGCSPLSKYVPNSPVKESGVSQAIHRSVTPERKHRSRSPERRHRSRSPERKHRSRSPERRHKSRSPERRERRHRSRSPERRERRHRSRSPERRERRHRSRSRRRSRSPERRHKSRSPEKRQKRLHVPVRREAKKSLSSSPEQETKPHSPPGQQTKSHSPEAGTNSKEEIKTLSPDRGKHHSSEIGKRMHSSPARHTSTVTKYKRSASRSPGQSPRHSPNSDGSCSSVE